MVTEITNQPINSITVTALEGVTLNCTASVDKATYSWHRVDDELPTTQRLTGQNSNMLTFHKILPPDEGMYYCVAKKMRVTAESNKVNLEVDGKLLHDINLWLGGCYNLLYRKQVDVYITI